MDQSTDAAISAIRIVAAAMPFGALCLWGVALIVTQGGKEGLASEAMPASLALVVWAVVALAGFGGSLFFKARALAMIGRARREEGGTDATARPLGLLIVSAALLEAPALLAGVLFLLVAEKELLWLAAGVYAVGLVMTFPRREWLAGPGRGAP